MKKISFILAVALVLVGCSKEECVPPAQRDLSKDPWGDSAKKTCELAGLKYQGKETDLRANAPTPVFAVCEAPDGSVKRINAHWPAMPGIPPLGQGFKKVCKHGE